MEDLFSRQLTKQEMDAMRRTAREEERVTRSFWKALRRVIHNAPFAEDLVAAFFCVKDPHTPARVRYLLLGALGYFILPLDAVPDILPLFGYGDDIAVLAAAFGAVAGAIKPEHRERAREVLADRQSIN